MKLIAKNSQKSESNKVGDRIDTEGSVRVRESL